MCIRDRFFIAINPKKFNSDYDSYLEELVNSIKTQEGSRLPGSKRLSKFNENVNKDIFISDELMSRIELI